MASVKALLDLWKAGKHIPQGKTVKDIIPKKNGQQSSRLRRLTDNKETLDWIENALSTLLEAWKALKYDKLNDTGNLDNPYYNDLVTEEALLIASIVPLYIPKELGEALPITDSKTKQPSAKIMESDASKKESLTFDDILNMDDDSDDLRIISAAEFTKGKKRAKSSPMRKGESQVKEQLEEAEKSHKKTKSSKSSKPREKAKSRAIQEEDEGEESEEEQPHKKAKSSKSIKPKEKAKSPAPKLEDEGEESEEEQPHKKAKSSKSIKPKEKAKSPAVKVEDAGDETL